MDHYPGVKKKRLKRLLSERAFQNYIGILTLIPAPEHFDAIAAKAFHELKSLDYSNNELGAALAIGLGVATT